MKFIRKSLLEIAVIESVSPHVTFENCFSVARTHHVFTAYRQCYLNVFRNLWRCGFDHTSRAGQRQPFFGLQGLLLWLEDVGYWRLSGLVASADRDRDLADGFGISLY